MRHSWRGLSRPVAASGPRRVARHGGRDRPSRPGRRRLLDRSGVGLAHRRLSIIDLAGGDQPIGNEDGSIQVVFNGEIYNYHGSPRAPARRRAQFRTRSDTEVLVHLYEEHGADWSARLRGMFAFALWDRAGARLLLARDRVGIKPLYLYRDDEKLLFGSEIKAILAHPAWIASRIPSRSRTTSAYGMVPGPRSIFRGDREAAAGPSCWLSARLAAGAGPHATGGSNRAGPAARTTEEWLEAIRAKVDEASRLHLIADVPVGAFLSGGIDSSVVVAPAAAQAAEPLQTFSIGFAGRSLQRAAVRAPGRRAVRHAITSEEIVTPDAVELARRARQVLRRAVRRLVGDPDVPGLAAGEPERQGGALGRRRRRGVRRLRAIRPRPEGGGAAAADPRRGSAVASWDRSPGAWPKADWLPRPLRAKTLLTNLSLDAGGRLRQHAGALPPAAAARAAGTDSRRSLNGHDPGRLDPGRLRGLRLPTTLSRR